LRELVHTAEAAGIPYQYRRFTGADTDAGAIALSREGVKAAVVSVPCRYIHSPHGVMRESDFHHTVALIRAWLQSGTGK
ncbi:MAG TPA: M42 family peptidase, partial [Bacillota bacterium]|nr:M42 family peptidase [Bacillota bacterium]